jgi:hypothetical protein
MVENEEEIRKWKPLFYDMIELLMRITETWL